jgi:hypothetical protein
VVDYHLNFCKVLSMDADESLNRQKTASGLSMETPWDRQEGGPRNATAVTVPRADSSDSPRRRRCQAVRYLDADGRPQAPVWSWPRAGLLCEGHFLMIPTPVE